jgi:transcriptional regulator with XRE-family HTH domain
MPTTPVSAELLRDLRRKRGQSLRAAAGGLGIAPSHLSRLERGVKSASPDLQRRAAGYYGVPQDVVLLAAGEVPADVVGILQGHPELLQQLRRLHGQAEPEPEV